VNAQTSSCHTLRVAGSDQWLPFSYVDPARPDRYRGIAHDTVQAIARHLGLKVEVVSGLPWKRIELALEQGTIDVIAGNYYTDERAKKWRLSEPFAIDEVRVFVHRHAPFMAESLSDLIGKSGVVPLGASLGNTFDAIKAQLTLHEVVQHKQMFAMLSKQRVDYMVLPHFGGLIEAENFGYPNIIPLDLTVSYNDVHLAFSRATACQQVIEKANAFIIRSRQNGLLDSIINRYIERSVTLQ